MLLRKNCFISLIIVQKISDAFVSSFILLFNKFSCKFSFANLLVTRSHSEMTSSQIRHFLDPFPLVILFFFFSLFTLTSYALPPARQRPKSSKSFLRKTNHKIYFGTNMMLHIIDLIINKGDK